MEFDWDTAKDAANRAKHGVGFDLARQIDWTRAQTVLDVRQDYGEPRFCVYARISGRLFCCVCTLRKGTIRIISMRKANRREERDYGPKAL